MSDNSAETFEENKSEMIEDEEMPTFISVSSKDMSLPYNTGGNIQLLGIDNPANNPLLLHPNNEENPDDYEAQSRSATTEEREEEVNDENEDGDGSVYVLSSGDDADDHDDPSSRSYDEDVDEEEDIDDEDDEDIDDMDEIDGDEEDIGVAEDGQLLGDFSEDEIEREDIMSDDMALRSDTPRVINNEKRSQSLQDLSGYGSQTGKKSFITGGTKYNRVQSKVKRYIQDLKEKNRRSAQNRLKIIEQNKKSQEFENTDSIEKKAEDYLQKSNRGRRSIKDYAEQAFKDLEIEEEMSQETDQNMPKAEATENCVTIPQNNLKNKGKLRTHEREHKRNDFNSGFRTAADIYKDKKINVNGELANNHPLENIKIPKGITLNYTTLNGQTQGQNILDVRSIGYDEYMRGNSNSSGDKHVEGTEVSKKLSGDEALASKIVITNIRSETQFNMEAKNDENVEEIPMEVVESQENHLKVVEQESNDKSNKEALAEIAIIQSQLNQKTTQCKEIRQAYEKTLSENFQLKQELEDLKKTLAKLTAKKPAPQLVTVAIQTDPLPPPPETTNESKDIQASENLPNPKLSTSSMGSALSSNEHWTESTGSLPISNGSIRPLPNLTPLSNAEDSFIGVASTPPRTPQQPSHAFQTSSKIIRMLSNITQKKPKGDGNLSSQENLSNVFGKGLASANPGISSYSSPLNHRGSNKRKASEMPENANFLQPSKIAHTSNGSSRLNRRHKSEFKYPGDFIKLNSQSSSADAHKTLENLESSQREDEPSDDLNSGVKCFTYREDDNSLETSFLIQAEDEAKNQDARNDGEQRSSVGVVRECGPYLLGNVEVRMTEINGTINIWGKEVSQETTIEDEPEEEPEIEEEFNERGACGCWHKTPNVRLSSSGPISCSTNKKPKIPPLRLNESAYLKSHHYSPSTLENFKDRQNVRNCEHDDNCRTCNSHSSNAHTVNKFRRFSNFGQEEEGEDNIPNNYYGCNWDNESCDNPSCGRVSRHCHHADHNCASSHTLNIKGTGTGRCSRLNSGNDNTRLKAEENFNRNQSSRLVSNHFEEDNLSSCRHGLRKDSPLDDDVFKRPSISNARVINDGCCKNESCRSHSTSFSNQSTDPLLSHHPHEPPEARRRRSSGKRVRGILMDFLRGCGDCRTTNGTDNKVSPSVIPQIRVRSSTPPPSPSSQAQQRTTNYGSTNKRCVHMECCTTCSRRIEMAAEIETQLEIFGAEMERLRSRSQTVLGMLNTLHSADTN